MLSLIAYLFQYGLIVASCLMLGWAVLAASKHTLTKRRWFRLSPLLLVGLMLGSTVYRPITITSPSTGSIVHPGDSIPLTIELRPAFLARLFPAVGVDVPACWSCKTGADGVIVRGTLAGPPYRFVIDLPKALPNGILVTSATAAMPGSRHPAMRSAFIELDVRPR